MILCNTLRTMHRTYTFSILIAIMLSIVSPMMAYAEFEADEDVDIDLTVTQQRELDAVKENERYWESLPTQDKRTWEASGINSAGQCLGDLAASILNNWFASFVTSGAADVAGSVTKPTLVPVYIPGLENKEVALYGKGPSLDSIGYCLTNALIQYISDATIAWIDNGFEGNPVFVDDPEAFFKEIKGDTFNAFFDTFGDGILCKQFDLDVKLALLNRVRPRRVFNCTYDRALANLQTEPFSFEVFADVTQNPMNNPIGAFLTIDSNYHELINSRQDTLQQQLTWNRGYLSWQDKDDPSKTVTPGAVVASGFEKLTTLKSDRLILADEFDEIMGALINQLIKGTLNELGAAPAFGNSGFR